MPTIEPQTLPHTFTCSMCEAELEVTQDEADEHAADDWTKAEAIENAMIEVHGWWRTPETGAPICENCLDEME
jgi:hypothetical protein